MLVWKWTALKMYMYLMGDDADCSFGGGFIIIIIIMADLD